MWVSQHPSPSSVSPAGRPSAAVLLLLLEHVDRQTAAVTGTVNHPDDTHLASLDPLHDAGELRHVLRVRHGYS